MASSFTKESRTARNSQPGDAARAALELADENEAIAIRIREIEDFISVAPGHAAKVRREIQQTIPPPEGHQQPLYRHPVTDLQSERPLSRRQAAAQLADRRRNMFVFIASAILFAVFACWLSRSL
ncbi:MAG: hypothetical protein VCA55_08870 [Verrucomicrobiales bacterium]